MDHSVGGLGVRTREQRAEWGGGHGEDGGWVGGTAARLGGSTQSSMPVMRVQHWVWQDWTQPEQAGRQATNLLWKVLPETSRGIRMMNPVPWRKEKKKKQQRERKRKREQAQPLACEKVVKSTIKSL